MMKKSYRFKGVSSCSDFLKCFAQADSLGCETTSKAQEKNLTNTLFILTIFPVETVQTATNQKDFDL